MGKFNENRICIVLHSATHIRNYISTGAFEKIAAKNKCLFLVEDTVQISEEFEASYDIIKFPMVSTKEYYDLLELMTFALRKKSKTFNFRIRRLYFPKLPEKFNDFKNIHKQLYFYLRKLKRLLQWTFLTILSSSIFKDLSVKIFKKRLKTNASLQSAICDFRPDLILAPSSAFDPVSMELISYANNVNLKTLLIIDNWDNLSSKSVLYELPSYLSVWGEQGKEHAVDIHCMKKENIFTLGTPRFDEYFKLRDTRLSSYFDFCYILFVGTALEFDERSALVEMNKLFSKNAIFNNYKIIYRPHPWRQSNNNFSIDDLQHVCLDPQVSTSYKQGEKSQQPDLQYYPALLQNAEAVVGGMTTMLIESLLMRTPFVALVWKDTKHVTNMRAVLQNYTHFHGINRVSALILNYDSKDLLHDLVSALEKKTKIDKIQLDKELNYFYTIQKNKFSDRLDEQVRNIIASKGVANVKSPY